MKTKYCAIIPARGGSKGIHRKNMAMIGSKPMLQYTIEAAQDSQIFDKIFFSSEDKAFISFVENMGLEVPYVRPNGLALDSSPTVDVVNDAIRWLEKIQSYVPDVIVLLQPTCPFRNAIDIINSIKTFENSDRNSLYSVNLVYEHPFDMVAMKNGKYENVVEHPGPGLFGRQQFPNVYYVNGAIYVVELNYFKQEQRFRDNDSEVFVMEPMHGFDIDEQYQLDLADAYVKKFLE